MKLEGPCCRFFMRRAPHPGLFPQKLQPRNPGKVRHWYDNYLVSIRRSWIKNVPVGQRVGREKSTAGVQNKTKRKKGAVAKQSKKEETETAENSRLGFLFLVK